MLIIVESVHRLPYRVEVEGVENNGLGVLIGGNSVKIDAGVVNYGTPGVDGLGADPVFVENTNNEIQSIQQEVVGLKQDVDALEQEEQIEEYIHNQPLASAVWSINHSMNRFPSVTAVDSSGAQFIGDISYLDNNNVIINFSVPIAGKAYLN